MKSKKLLFVALDKFFNTDKYTKEKLKAVGNETYGRQSCIYINAGTPMLRRKLEGFLKKDGFKVCTDYWPGSAMVEVQVSYFRGDQWDV
jgi:hypothetical protein